MSKENKEKFEKSSQDKKGKNIFLSLILPVSLIILLFAVFLNYGPLGVFKASFPPIEDISVEKVVFTPEEITLEIFNNGPQEVTVAQVFVNDIMWNYEITSSTLKPRERGKIFLSFPWVEGNPIAFKIMASDGVAFEKEVDVAFLTPKFNWTYFNSFVLLGLYVGVIPVLLGLLFFPFLRQLKPDWSAFFLSLTIGLLVFLGVDALIETSELITEVPSALNGAGIALIGFILAILILQAVSYKTEKEVEKTGKTGQNNESNKALTWGYLIALGIGLHNMGEGLAIGSAYAIGEIALGGSLVLGFMIHNLTEGIAIVSPLTRAYKSVNNIVYHIVIMGLIAGIPTIIGALIGGFAFSVPLAILFFAIGAGAILDVAYDIAHSMAKEKWLSLFTVTNCIGFLAGMLIMYATGYFVLG